MQNYINQLIEILQEAHDNRPTPSLLELPEEMECLRDIIELEKSMEKNEQTMENIFGVPRIYFPPENKLTDEQILQVKDEIVKLWRVFHYEPDFREGEFDIRQQYSMLIEKWNDHVPLFRGTNGTWHLEMYDYEKYWDTDEMRYLTDEEYKLKFPPPNMDEMFPN